MMPFGSYELRAATADDAAAIFVIHAAITSTDAGEMVAWTGELEERLESGSRAWVAARGRRLAGYAVADPIPGLPGVYDLSGGMVPARRRQGLGTRLLRHVQMATADEANRQLSCRVDSLETGAARFLLARDFYLEHEECLLELRELSAMPPIPDTPAADLRPLPQERAVVEFCRVYEAAFAGRPWSQPYTSAEVAAALAGPDDLLFAMIDAAPVGVVWHEVLPDGRGRIEPLGIAAEYQGRGLGRRLLLAALHRLRGRGASSIEIGVWRDNIAAMHLYGSLGFAETGNWFYLACDLDGLKTE